MSRVIRSRGPGSLARGALITTIATATSRVTGLIRVVVVASVLGATFLGNTYQTANTAPNVVFELVAAGVLTSIFVPTFVEYIAKGRRDQGWDAANALTSVALVALVGLSLLVALAAPLIMSLLTIGVDDPALRDAEVALGTKFLYLFAPQITFYGVGMIMTGALHANRRFGMPAIAPIFNNVVVIAVYLVYGAMREGRPPDVEGITAAETWVLGAGTTLGVVAMTVCLIPQLRQIGWRFRFNFDPAHPAVRKGARLGAWALGYAGGYQAGLIVVLVLANKVEGGVAAYQWAYTFFYLPHALFAVPIFNVLFTAMSEHFARDQEPELVGRLRDGLAMLVFILLPVSALLLAAAEPLARLTLEYGVMSGAGAGLVARVLVGFAIGLPAYSAFLVFTRGYYAIGDTRTPALVNALTILIGSVTGAVLFSVLGERWSVPGLAFGHSAGFFFGAIVLSRLFYRRLGATGRTNASVSMTRSALMSALALAAMLAVRVIGPEGSKIGYAVNLIAVAAAGLLVYVGGMSFLGVPELDRIRNLAPRRRGGRRRAPR